MAIGYGVVAKKSDSARKTLTDKRAKAKLWRDVKAAVLARDKRCCRVCGLKGGTDAHHIKLRSAGGEDTTANLATLCRVCHNDVHAYRIAITGDANKKLTVTRF